MSSWRRTHAHRTPTRKERSKIFFTGFQLSELFTTEEIADFMSAAKRRAVGEFFYATERNPRYRPGCGMKPRRGTDNYICELSSRPSDLAKYVLREMHRGFIARHQLPSELTELESKLVETIIYRAQYDVLLETVNTMRRLGEIWYDEALGIWQIRQSCVDEFLEFRKAARRSVKVDDRSYHGRVRSQSAARGAPEGVSVSFA